MKRKTRAELEESERRLSRENGVLERMMSYLAAGATPSTAFVTDESADGSSYVFSLYDETGAHGGIVLEQFRHPGQRNAFSAYYLDDVRDGIGFSEYRDMKERFIRHRWHACHRNEDTESIRGSVAP